MGVCYKLFLEEEWDWSLFKVDKNAVLKEFEGKYDGYIERIAEWYQFVVYNVEKSVPYTDERLKLIREYANKAYYTTDMGIGITELKLPVMKASAQAYIDDMNSRRTEEQKKASEEQCRQKLEKMNGK